MFCSAIVQYPNDFSDRQMEHFTRFGIITKWFIGIPIEDRSYDNSALGDFRDRLGEKRWKKLFFSLSADQMSIRIILLKLTNHYCNMKYCLN